MTSDLLCTTDAMSAVHFKGGWRPLSTDPAIQVPSLVAPAKRSW